MCWSKYKIINFSNDDILNREIQIGSQKIRKLAIKQMWWHPQVYHENTLNMLEIKLFLFTDAIEAWSWLQQCEEVHLFPLPMLHFQKPICWSLLSQKGWWKHPFDELRDAVTSNLGLISKHRIFKAWQPMPCGPCGHR